MPVGDALLSAFFQVLFDRLASKYVVEFVFGGGDEVAKVVKSLKRALQVVDAVLNDAEEKQVKSSAVRAWLDELKDTAFDAEDVLDELIVEALQWKFASLQPQATSGNFKQVWKFIPTSLNPSLFRYNLEIEPKMKDITEKLDDLSRQVLELGLRQICPSDHDIMSSWKQRETTSLVHDGHVYGRDSDREKVVELLLESERSPGREEIAVVPIVGMGGIGKTTLAKLVFNDKRVRDSFDVVSWVCVSDNFDVKLVSKKILDSVSCWSSNLSDLNQVQVSLKIALSGKRFLIVLDSVWNKNYAAWNELLAPLREGAPGSTILVTTRSADVARMMGTVEPHFLGHLSESDCWLAFAQHAFKGRKLGQNPRLVEIGERIAKKCKGLPLAAATLGGVLRSKEDDEGEWENVLRSEIWDLSEEESDILPVLRLSYYHLPSHLKRCFAYCSILPKDYEFGERDIVLLWMAEGMLQQRQGRKEKQMEDVGRDYFQDLVSRSLFQPSNDNKQLFVMHDLINDLAQCVAGETCFKLDSKKRRKFSKKARHLAYISHEFDSAKSFEPLLEVKFLRTFLPLTQACDGWHYLSHKIPFKLLPELSCLRVLSLNGYYINELPMSIGDLRLLRYLALSNTNVRRLPETVSNLFNLQSLLLNDCVNLENLPRRLGDLANLRHLELASACSLSKMPKGMGSLTNLRTLSMFVASESDSCRVEELMKLSNLQGSLSILRLENVANGQEASKAELFNKPGIEELVLQWSRISDDSSNSEEESVLYMLRPGQNLKRLVISNYGGSKFPTWIADPTFKNLTFLTFENCVKCTSLPPLGRLPFLKQLHVIGMKAVSCVGVEFYGTGCPRPFTSLEILSFEDMEEWKDWSVPGIDKQIEPFPSLQQLSLIRCHKLEGQLPRDLPSLKTLVVNQCEQLVVKLSGIPTLCKMEIERCKGLVPYNSVKLSSLVLSRISEFTCSTQGSIMQAFREVEELKIFGCEAFMSLWQEEAWFNKLPQGLPSVVKVLEIRNCENLKSLPKAMMSTGSHLRRLNISCCPSLTSIARGQLPPTLESLEITNCRNLECVLKDEDEASSSSSSLMVSNVPLLEYLYIGWCPSLTRLSARGELPPALKSLLIWSCSELRSLSLRGMLPRALKQLEIQSCAKLESIAEDFHGNTLLESIQIWNCNNLKAIPAGLCELTNLSHFKIVGCPSLVSFPGRGLPTTNMRELCVVSCETLEALPNNMDKLTSLQDLDIEHCPGIVSFPAQGFPTNLTSLWISDLNISKALFAWGLHRITALRDLTLIGGCPDLVCFPSEEEENGIVFPSSLTSLSIQDFPNVKCLSSKGFRNLTSLTSLSLRDLPNLKCLCSKGFHDLVSLEELSIYNCAKLTSFPNEGLPSSVLQLDIQGCPLLTQACQKDRGKDWSKIANIPYVEIEGRFIYDSEED